MADPGFRALQKIEPSGGPLGGGQMIWIPAGYELATEPPPPAQKESHLWDYIWLVWRGRWLIAFVFCLCSGVALFQALRAIPIYVASAKLHIASQTPQIIEFRDSIQGDLGNSDKSLPTQIQFLQSRTLARKVIEDLHLYSPPADASLSANATTDTRPLATPVAGNSGLPAFTKSASGDAEAGLDSGDLLAMEVDSFLSALSVNVVRDTEIVEVSFMDPDPALCARVANAVCEAYMALNYQTKTKSYDYATKWIEQKLYDVKANLEKSEENLYAVAGGGEDALALTQDAVKFTGKVEEMDSSLLDAERDMHDKEFQLEFARKNLATESLLSSGTQTNAFVDSLRTDLKKCEVDYDQALQRFGPEMPQVKSLRAAKTRLETQIADETSRNKESALSKAQFDYDQAMSKAQFAYEQAKSKRDFLKTSYEQQKERMLSIQQRLIKFNILKREVEANRELYNNLLQRSREVGVTSSIEAGNVAIVEAAERPLEPTLPNRRRMVMLGGFIGIVLGIGLVFFREYMDTTVRGAIDVQNYGKMASLGFLPYVNPARTGKGERVRPELISEEDPLSVFAENMRHLRTLLQYSLADHAPRTVLVTSAMSSEGKTTVATNLAIALAQSGRRTILVDADLKKPCIHKLFNVSHNNGLSDILTGRINGNLATRLVETKTENLYFLPAGERPPNPVDLLDSDVMRRLLRTLSAHFDHVILDCPPTLELADTEVLFRHVDGVVIVVRPGKTPRAALTRVNEKIHEFGGRVLGAVLNGRKMRSSKRYGYGYGYGGYRNARGVQELTVAE